MPLRVPEPGTYEDQLRLVRLDVSRLIRLSISPATEPFWSRHARYRFDAPAVMPVDQRFGVCYAGSITARRIQ